MVGTGGENTKYFFNLEKRNGELTSISKLLINNIVTEDGKKISQFVTQFYKDLYTSNFVSPDLNDFLDSVVDKAKVIDDLNCFVMVI